MRAGTLRHRITIEEKTGTSDGMGGFTNTWSDLHSCAAAIWPLSAREQSDSLKLELNINYRIRIRHPRINLTADMRIKWHDPIAGADKYFNIVSIINPDERNIMIDFLALRDI